MRLDRTQDVPVRVRLAPSRKACKCGPFVFHIENDKGPESARGQVLVWVENNREPNPGIAAANPGVTAPLSLTESLNALMLASQRRVGHQRGDHGDALLKYGRLLARYQMFPAPGV